MRLLTDCFEIFVWICIFQMIFELIAWIMRQFGKEVDPYANGDNKGSSGENHN